MGFQVRIRIICLSVGKPIKDLLMKSFSNGLEFPFNRMNETNFIYMGTFFTKIRNLHPAVTLRQNFRMNFQLSIWWLAIRINFEKSYRPDTQFGDLWLRCLQNDKTPDELLQLLKIYQSNYCEMSIVPFTDVLSSVLSISMDLNEKYLIQCTLVRFNTGIHVP